MRAQSDMENNEAAHSLEAGILKEPLLSDASHSSAVENNENEAEHQHYVFESPSRPWWRGNINLYLGTCYFVVLWFVLQRGPGRFTKPISTMAGIHVVAACLYGIICCINVFHTPSHGTIYRRIHMNLGRVGMAAGVVSVALGMTVLYVEDTPLGMQIGLTYAGIAQLATQVLGMYELFKPKRNLKRHAMYMRQSLLFACLIPALMRLPQLTGFNLGEYWEAFAWVFAIPLYAMNDFAEKNKRWY